MWASIVKLFEPSTKKHVPWQETVLHEGSLRLDPPPVFENKIVLWDHQKAMLARCVWIEKNKTLAATRTMYAQRFLMKEKEYWPRPEESVSIGVMNDPPGAGKTNVMLALIGLDVTDVRPNVIIAPRNILAQWEAAVEAIYGPASPCLPFSLSTSSTKNVVDGAIKNKLKWCTVDYQSINKLYLDKDVFESYRILLLVDTLTDTFALAYPHGSTVHRAIIDEVDNLARLMTQPIGCTKLWFISASFNPDDMKTVDALPYTFDPKTVGNFLCCSDPTFVKNSIQLPPPKLVTVECEDADVLLFVGIVDDKTLRSLHAGSLQKLVKTIDFRDFQDYSKKLKNIVVLSDLARWYADECSVRAKHARDVTTVVEEHAKEQLQIAERYEGHRSLLLKRLEAFVPPPPEKKKWSLFQTEIVDTMISSAQQSKWLIFNDDLDGLIEASKLLDTAGVKCSMLDGGNTDKIQETLRGFKDGDTQALLLNSTNEGCGLNLENATHILFMHATDEALVEQIVGRAQRFGRRGTLTIIGLLNKSEK